MLLVFPHFVNRLHTQFLFNQAPAVFFFRLCGVVCSSIRASPYLISVGLLLDLGAAQLKG